MMDSLLARSAAPLAIVAGALVAVTRVVALLTAPSDSEPLKVVVLTATHAINSVTSIVAYAMLVLALVACHSIHARAAGVLGVIGLGAAILGTVFVAGDWWFEAFAVPWLAEVAPVVLDNSSESGRLLLGTLLSFVLFGIGWVLYGIASVRARVFPTPLSWAVVASGLLSAIPISYVIYGGSVILGLAFILLGAWLMRSGNPRNADGAASQTDQPDRSRLA